MDAPKRYETIKHSVGIAGFVLEVFVLIYLLTSGSTFRIRDFARTVADSEAAVVLVYAVVVGAILKAMQLPLSFYSGYIVEHRFGLSRQSIWDWMRDQFKALVLGSLMAILAVELIYYLLRNYPSFWWLYASMAFAGVFVLLSNLAPILLLPLFFKFRRIEDEELNRRVDRLARQTGAPVCGLFEWSLADKTRKANAAVIGWGNTRRIIVSDTLLANFSGEEIEIIMAHELCHHVKHHVWTAMAVQSLVTLVAFFVVHRVLTPVSVNSFQGISDVANLPLFSLVVMSLSMLALPAVNWFSRRLETAADTYALDVTGDALAFVSSMEKLAETNLADKAPNKILEFIFYSHPSIEKRIKLAADRVGQNV